MRHLSVSLVVCLLLAMRCAASTIDFEAQAAGRGGNLTGVPDSPLTIGAATFTGGELLNAEAGLNADQTGVYASEGLFGSGETNPLAIAFASPVSDVSILVLNGDDARNYTVSDNLGDSISMSLPSAGGLGAATFSLPGNGLTSVQITSANADGWDFAIDNVTFAPTVVTPEPRSILLLAFGVALLALLALRTRGGFDARYRSWSRTKPASSRAFKSEIAQ